MKFRMMKSQNNLNEEQFSKPINYFRRRKTTYESKHPTITTAEISDIQNCTNLALKSIDDNDKSKIITNFWKFYSVGFVPKINQTLYEKKKRILVKSYSHFNEQKKKLRNHKKIKIRRNVDICTYQRQLNYFIKLYELYSNVLTSIKYGWKVLQIAVSEYGKYIRDPSLSFIDDFIAGKQKKIQRTIYISRIHEYLSIAYLFLEISQERTHKNQNFLTNFIGYTLSNIIFTAKIYILLERRPQFPQNQFQKQMKQYQIVSYAKTLTNMEDILLRVQHNNEIITMIHKRLGKLNEKFEDNIGSLLRTTENKKYSTYFCGRYIFECLAKHIHETQLVGISSFLQVSPAPYLPPPKHTYTLVFQPLGTMIYNQRWRPYLVQFIQWASKHFDLVLWTWEMPDKNLDIIELFNHSLFAKLYRFHCIVKYEIYCKDLNRLGRDLTKTLIIDYDERIFADTPKNGFTARWRGSLRDKGLLVIAEILEDMIKNQGNVQDMLTFYAEEINNIKNS